MGQRKAQSRWRETMALELNGNGRYHQPHKKENKNRREKRREKLQGFLLKKENEEKEEEEEKICFTHFITHEGQLVDAI